MIRDMHEGDEVVAKSKWGKIFCKISSKRISESGGGNRWRKTKRRKKRKREREGEERERERRKGRKTGCSSSDLRRFDGRSLPGRELKSIYSMRATLQKVEILPTWFIFTLRAVWSNFGTVGNAALFSPYTLPSFLGLVSDWETEGIWTRVLHRSCSCICELDVRLLNHLN